VAAWRHPQAREGWPVFGVNDTGTRKGFRNSNTFYGFVQVKSPLTKSKFSSCDSFIALIILGLGW
jgi:hypothetical protein